MKRLAMRMIAVLVSVSLISGLILALTWDFSESKIAKNQKKNIEKAIFEILPAATAFKLKTVEGRDLYFIYKNKAIIGKFFIADGNGFQGNIKIAVMLDKNMEKIIGIRILEQTETPGLGNKIVDTSFISKFEGINIMRKITVLKQVARKENSEVEAITGATISSKAVANILNTQIELIKALTF